jgi:hypothetical protein
MPSLLASDLCQYRKSALERGGRRQVSLNVPEVGMARVCAQISTKPFVVRVWTLYNFGHCPSNLPIRNLKLGGNMLRSRRAACAEKGRKRLDDVWHHATHFEQTVTVRMRRVLPFMIATPHNGTRIRVCHTNVRDGNLFYGLNTLFYDIKK